MEEVEIVISVNSDEAVAGTEKEIAALKELEAQAGKTSAASDKRAQKSQKALKDEETAWKKANKAVSDYNKALADAEKLKGKGLPSGMDYNSVVQAATKQRDAVLKQAGFTTDGLIKENNRRLAADAKANADREAERVRSDARMAAQAKAAADRGDALAQRVADFRSKLYREMYDDQLKKAQAADDAEARIQEQAQQRGMRYAAIWNAAHAQHGKVLEDEAARAKRDADDEEKLLKGRTSNWQRFFNDIERAAGKGGSHGGGGGIFSGAGNGGSGGGGGLRGNQLSRNRFIDFGGRGIQPRTVGIGSLIGLGAAAAGPVGAAAGGLLGAVPGAAFGIGSAVAAIKMSGIGQLAGDAAKIKTIQDQIAAGVTKEAKGRAQIAAIMRGLTPEQQKGLALWQGFQKVTADIGKNVQDKLLPAFGNIGKAISADAPIIARSIETAGGAMANLLTNFSGFISKGAGKALFAGTAGAGNTFITGLMSSLGDLGEAFLGIGNASQKFMHQMAGMGNALTKSFAGWADSKGGQAQLKSFFAVAAQEIPRVLGLFKDLGKVLFTIFAAALPFANQFIDAVRHALQNLNTFLQSTRGQNDMKELFGEIATAIKGVATIVQTLWPIFSGVFDKIKSLVQGVAGIFGTKFATVFTLIGVYFASKVLTPVSAGLNSLAKGLLKLVLTNPWVAAVAGTVVLVAWLSTLKTDLQNVGTAARNTANDIKNAFAAASDRRGAKLDLNVQSLTKGVQQGSIYDLRKKISGEQAKGKAQGFTPGLIAQISADSLALARLRQAYNTTKNAIAADTKQISDDNKKQAADVKKAHDDMEKAYSSALNSTKKPNFNTPRGGGSLLPNTPDFTKAAAAFQKYFRTIDTGSDNAGQRVRLAMDKIAAYAAKFGHLPSQKWVSLLIKDLASKTVAQITRALLRMPSQKTIKIIAENKQALQSIAEVADKHVKDKHFSIIGAILAPNLGNPLKLTNPVELPNTRNRQAGGGVVPGMGGNDSVPTLLQPGEVVLNRRQQYDFGGPQQFSNYFSSQKMAKGGVVGARIIGDSPTSGLILNSTGAVVGGVGTGTGPATVANSGGSAKIAGPSDPEPGWASVVALLKSRAPAQKMWANRLKWDTLSYNSIRDDYLSKDYDTRSNLADALHQMTGDHSKSATDKRKVIYHKQKLLGTKINREVVSKRHTYEQMVRDRANLKTARKVYSHIPGYDAFEGALNSIDAQQAGLEWQAGNLPAYNPAADANAPNGITTLTNAWNNINSAYQGTVSRDDSTYQARIAWLQGLVPQLGKSPKYQSVANAEIVSDQRDALAIFGKSLAEQLPSGTGPGDTITGGATTNTDWSKDQSTVAFTGNIAGDAAQIAMALLNGDGNSWTSAMSDEAALYLKRLSDLGGAKDNPVFASMRTDILDEITSDASAYQDIKSALAAGFAAAQGSDGGSDDQHVQDVIDSANALMSEINVGTSSERESLGLLTNFLASQVPSYETGAAYVGKSGLAMLHQGERVTARGDTHTGGYGHSGTLTIDGTGPLGKLLAQHMSYEMGQTARRHSRERRR